MKKRMCFASFPALFLSFSAFCGDNVPADTQTPRADPRVPYRAAIDAYIQNYVKPETEISTVFQPESKGRETYAEEAGKVREIYQKISLFLSAKKWNAVEFSFTDQQDPSRKIFVRAEREKKHILLRIQPGGENAEPVVAEAEIPDVLQMPKSISPDQEEAVSRELNLFFQFLMNPEALAKSVTLQQQDMLNTITKKVEPQPQQFLVNDQFCFRFLIVMKELYGGGLVYVYTTCEEPYDICRIDIPTLALDPVSASAFSLSLGEYDVFKPGFVFPKTLSAYGKNFKLDAASLKADIPAPSAPAVPAAPSAKEENVSAPDSASEKASEKKPESADDAEEDSDALDSASKEEKEIEVKAPDFTDDAEEDSEASDSAQEKAAGKKPETEPEEDSFD